MLEKLLLSDMVPSDDDGAISARNALSFLRTNVTLKSLTVTFVRVREESYVSTFRLEAVKMMNSNPSLESLTISTSSKIKVMKDNPHFFEHTIRQKAHCRTCLHSLRDTTQNSWQTAFEFPCDMMMK
jgi:hypothetical protein